LRYRTLLILTIIIATSIPTAQATFVEMEKTHTPEKTEYFCGETLEFNITITVRTTAGGPILSIEDLKIIDYLAPGVTILPGNWTSTPSSNFTDYGNGTLLWDFGPGPFTTEPQATVAFNVTVNQDAPENTYLINTATAKYNETASGAASAPTVTDTIRIIYPIINITKYCSGPILEGGWINYTIMLTNHGHMDDENITLTDHLPPGTIYTPGTASATSGTLDESQLPGKLLWRGVLPNVTGLNTVNITIPVQDDPLEYSQQHTNNASFTELTGCERVERRWVTCNTIVLPPQLNLEKTCTASSTTEPANVTYTYNLANTGDTVIFNATVFDQTLNQTIIPPIHLPPGATVSANLTLLNVSAGTHTNIALAWGTPPLEPPVNDTDSATCTIREKPPAFVGGAVTRAIPPQLVGVALAVNLLLLGLVAKKLAGPH